MDIPGEGVRGALGEEVGTPEVTGILAELGGSKASSGAGPRSSLHVSELTSFLINGLTLHDTLTRL